MKLARGVVAVLVLVLLVGCTPPHRVSVRSDGVMAFWGKEGVLIYDPGSEKITRVKPVGDLAKMDLLWADWSPDGTKLLIGGGTGSMGGIDKLEMQVGNADGTDFKKLFSLEKEGTYFAQWRPDGKAVAFVAWREDAPSELREVDVATGQMRVLMKGACIFHRYHPQGEGVAAVGGNKGLDDHEPFAAVLTWINSDGSADAGAAFMTGIHPWLDWSPDGESLLFCVPKTEMPFPLATGEDEIKKTLSRPGLYVISDEGDIKRLTRRSIGPSP